MPGGGAQPLPPQHSLRLRFGVASVPAVALDAAGWQPRDEAGLMRYCWHVAGAVGVMMAVVMVISGDGSVGR